VERYGVVASLLALYSSVFALITPPNMYHHMIINHNDGPKFDKNFLQEKAVEATKQEKERKEEKT
jgi:hypothetical protein